MSAPIELNERQLLAVMEEVRNRVRNGDGPRRLTQQERKDTLFCLDESIELLTPLARGIRVVDFSGALAEVLQFCSMVVNSHWGVAVVDEVLARKGAVA